MTTAASEVQPPTDERLLRTGAALMTFALLGFVFYGVATFFLNFSDTYFEPGIGPKELGLTKQEVVDFSPQLYHYMSHLQIALGAFLASTGAAGVLLAWYGVRARLRWAWVGAVVITILAFVVALPAHYPHDLATLLHVGPAYLGLSLLILGALITWRPVFAAPDRT